MARWTGHDEIELVLEGAGAWRDRCFQADGSILTDRALWTTANLDDLHHRFAGNPIEGTDQRFYEKLAVQLGPAPPHIKQLAAEAIWLTLLFPNSIKPETKRQRVQEIWGWSGEVLAPAAPYLDDAYLAGVGNPGIGYMTGLPNEFGFGIDAVRQWKARPAADRVLGQGDAGAWEFAMWLDSIEGADSRPMRNALAYFLYPDQFERNLSSGHRLDIYTALKSLLPAAKRPGANPSLLDLDRAIYTLRTQLEQRLGTAEIDFYREPLKKMWGNEDREKRRKQLASSLEKILSDYNLELNQPGSKKKILENTRPTRETTGYWQNSNDATNKPLRWLLHLDLTGEILKAQVPQQNDGTAQHGSRRIAFVNTAQGKSGAVLVRIVPAMKVAADRYEFFETWEWLLLLCFLPNLPVGSAAQLLDDFDPETGVLTYMGKRQPYIAAALVGLNDSDASFITEVAGTPKTITYAEATAALADLLHVDLRQPASSEAEAREGDQDA